MAAPRFGSLALRTGVPFAAGMTLFFAVQRGLVPGLMLGVSTGIAFGLAMAFFAVTQAKKFDAIRPEFEPEGLVLDGAANHKASGGWLFLTEHRLVFVPHRLNVGAKRIELARADIRAVKPTSKRRLELETSRGDMAFVVSADDPWAAKIPR
jgi:hypothetical protein